MALDQELARHRAYLLRFARLQLRNEAWAEDAVSETLLAALARPAAFEGRSQLRTWLVGILKHKVLDALREHRREVTLQDEDGAATQEALEAALFRTDGHYAVPPADWGDPEQALARREFFAVLEACAALLPPALGRVFLMREWLELSSEEICRELRLTPGHLHVQLHRARQRLRTCLDERWFGRHR